MKYIVTQETAITLLKNLFIDPSKDVISINEAYLAGKRDLNEEKRNNLWLRNQIAKTRQYGLIKTRLGTKNGKNKITHIKLTEQGKIALNRIDGQLSMINTHKPELKPEAKNGKNQHDITQLITKLSQDNPNRKIIYDINGGTISLDNKE